jgi:hypothetical protein
MAIAKDFLGFPKGVPFYACQCTEVRQPSRKALSFSRRMARADEEILSKDAKRRRKAAGLKDDEEEDEEEDDMDLSLSISKAERQRDWLMVDALRRQRASMK